MGDSSDDDMPLAARLAPAKTYKKEQHSNAVKAEKGDTEEPGPSSKSGPSKAKAEAKAHENGASKAEPAQRKKAAKEAKGKEAAKDEKDAAKPKKERKVFDMPGQTRETPDETDPLRKFYTSLREQRPDSAIAKKWLLQTGLLPLEEAEEEVAKGKNKSPAKPSRKSGSSAGGGTGRTGGSASAGPSRTANGTSKAPARKQAANGGAKPRGKKRKAEWSEDEEESSSDEDFNSDDEVPLAQRAKAKVAAAKKPPAPKRPSKKSKDVAFADGGLGNPGSDSEDDIPIGQRLKK